MVYDGAKWQVTRLADNTSFEATEVGGKLTFDGLEVTVGAGAAKNDSFTLKPVSDAIINMGVKVTNESQIAMAESATAGESDNRNGQALLDLQKKDTTVGGSKSFNDAYATLVSDVGSKTATLKTSSTTQGNVVTQLSNQQQSISGVNLDEEASRLIQYQQSYQAAAKVLQVAQTVFDTLLSINR